MNECVISAIGAIKGEISTLHALAETLPQSTRDEIHALGDRVWAQAKRIEELGVAEVRERRRLSA